MNIQKLSIMSLAALMVSCSGDKTQYDATGVFEATEVIVSAKVQGEITHLSFEEGDIVKAGQQLGVIDFKKLSLQKEQLIESRESNDSRVLNIKNQIASLQQQIANNKRERERFQELVKAEAATQKQVDDITYQISVLERQVAAQQEQLESQNKATERQSSSIDKQISSVDEQLADANISSPIDGTILTKYVEQGEFATPGRALFKVADLTNMTLRAYVDAPQLTNLKIGQKVTVYADKGEDERTELQGTITWISQKAEFTPKTIQTRDERANLVYAVKVTVKNDGTVKAGMYGDVKF